jgi:N-acetylmuramoyl-L-alanine amidase
MEIFKSLWLALPIILMGCFASPAPVSQNGTKADAPPEDPQESAALTPEAANTKRLPVIVIDPGHGGVDDGAIGIGGMKEKDYVLQIALKLEQILESKLPVQVELTRRSDVFIPLSERTDKANKLEAVMFVSLHANASPNGRAHGLETYYLDNAKDEASRLLAERENASLQFEEMGDVDFILSDLIQTGKLDDSIGLAHAFHDSVLRGLRKTYPKVRGLGVKKAPFYVLVGAHMPCVLVELFFINSSVDGKYLMNPQFRDDLSQSLYQGVESFLKKRKIIE